MLIKLLQIESFVNGVTGVAVWCPTPEKQRIQLLLVLLACLSKVSRGELIELPDV